MVRKSYGKMRGTRYKLQGKKRPTVNGYLMEFKKGDSVHVDFIPPTGIPDPKFQGKTGKVVSKRGRGYEVEVTDFKAKKTIFVKPEHLKKGG
jgi:large subunit ribosomal protein L21e